MGLPGSRSAAWSLLAHFRLDSHFHPRQWGKSPRKDACSPGRRGAGSRFTDEPLPQEARWRGALAAAAAAEPARGPARARPPPGPGALPPSALPRRSYGVSPPLITRLRGTSQQEPAPPEGFGELPKKPGRRSEGRPRLGLRGGRELERAGESRRGVALHAEVSLLNRLEFS